MTNKFFIRALLLLTTVSCASLSAHEITYRIKDFSHFAHKMIGDQGQNVLYIVPLDGVSEHLDNKFGIKRSMVRAVNNRMVPGKTFVQMARFMVFQSQSEPKVSEPKLLFGSMREGVPHTYVVLKDRLVFVESTKNPLQEGCKDRFSKHYVISGLKEHVLFAGEFYVYHDASTKAVHVVFDNASGTYRPDTDMLPMLAKTLVNNLGNDGIYVHVKSFDQKVDAQKMFAGHPDFLTKQAI